MAVRIVLGLVIVAVAFLLLMDTLFSNPLDFSKPIDPIHFENVFLMMLGEAVAIGIGVGIFGWGFRAHSSE